MEMEECSTKDLKSHAVEVNIKGRIGGTCKGGNAWDDTLKNITPHVLDIYVVHVRD